MNNFHSYLDRFYAGVQPHKVEAELKGGIWYDEASGQVKRTTKATYNIIGTETGTKYSISANDFSTGSRVSNGKGYFWGKCSFTGQMTDDYGIHHYANFGSKQVSFYKKLKPISLIPTDDILLTPM